MGRILFHGFQFQRFDRLAPRRYHARLGYRPSEVVRRQCLGTVYHRKKIDGKYKYFFYFSGNTPDGKAIGVATADHPCGPFTDSGQPIINRRPKGQNHGQQIDVDVFEDPVSGKSYLYWGNGYMAGAELNEDMMSIKPETEILA